MTESSFLNPAKVVHLAGIHEGMQVADFDTGAGFFARALARAVGPHGVVWAIGSRRDMLPRVKNLAVAEGLHNVEVVYGSIDRERGSNLPSSAFDACIIANALFAVHNKDAVAGEAARVLKRGGIAVVVDWKDSFGGLGPHPDHLVTKERAQEIFEKHGFADARDIPAGAYHWGCILKKKS